MREEALDQHDLRVPGCSVLLAPGNVGRLIDRRATERQEDSFVIYLAIKHYYEGVDILGVARSEDGAKRIVESSIREWKDCGARSSGRETKQPGKMTAA